VCTHVIDGQNVWMIQGAGRLGLLLEPPQAFRVLRKGCRKNFDRHFAIKLGIFGQVHLAHSTRADLRTDFVTAEFCAGSQAHNLKRMADLTIKSNNESSLGFYLSYQGQARNQNRLVQTRDVRWRLKRIGREIYLRVIKMVRSLASRTGVEPVSPP